MIKKFHRRLLTGGSLLMLAVFGLSLAGCDDTVDPIIESDQQITLFATLDMYSDVQWVRFIPIRGLITSDTINPDDYSFQSTDETTGETIVWEDSVHVFDNGSVGLLYRADLRVQPGHTYSFEARKAGSDLVTTASTTIPSQADFNVEPEEVEQFVGPTGFVVLGTQDVEWTGLDSRPFKVELWYRFLRAPTDPFRDIKIDPVPLYTYENGTLSMTMNLPAQRVFLADSLDLNRSALMGIGMEVSNLDDKFVPPGGVFDPEILVQPGTFSNVTNGFGFIGSVSRFRAEWTLSDESLRLLRYQTPRDLFGKQSQ